MNLLATGKPDSTSFFGRSQLFLGLSMLVILVLGLGIRLYDLTDPPMDFHPTRQIRGLVIARGMYYQMMPAADPSKQETARAFWGSMVDREPQIMERMVALTYLALGQEAIWVARVYSSLAWVIGGVVLFLLARRMVSVDGAVLAVAFYLFLPFGITASRSFQPDPIMVLGFLLAAYALYRWSERPTWQWALWAGALAGLAVLWKLVIAFLIAGMTIGVVLKLKGFKRALRDAQVWTMAALMVLPAAFYYIFGIQGAASSFLQGSTISILDQVLSPSYFMRWAIFLHGMFGLGILFIGLAGVMLSRPVNRAMLFGLWVGYGVYGLFFPHHIPTHEYYHLQLIPVAALSLAPVGDLVLSKIGAQHLFWRALTIGLMLVGAAYPLLITRSVLAGQDFRSEARFWQAVGDAVPDDGKTIALTQNYGHYLSYYGWQRVKLWPTTGELNLAQKRGKDDYDFQAEFADRTADMDYFLVTTMAQLNAQSDLKDTLYNQYPVLAEGDGYLLFDLRNPMTSQ